MVSLNSFNAFLRLNILLDMEGYILYKCKVFIFVQYISMGTKFGENPPSGVKDDVLTRW